MSEVTTGGRACRDSRAVSTALNYVLLLGIVAILVSVILVGATDFVEDRREETMRSELTVQGNRLAADLTTADTLAATAGSAGVVSLKSPLTERVARHHYRVSIDSAGPTDTYELTLEPTDADVVVTVFVRTEHAIEAGRFSGGTLWLRYNATADRLEVASD